MIILYNQHWDLIPGKEEAYTKFVIDKHLPTMKKIGINMVGGFHVVVGGVRGSPRQGQWMHSKNFKKP